MINGPATNGKLAPNISTPNRDFTINRSSGTGDNYFEFTATPTGTGAVEK